MTTDISGIGLSAYQMVALVEAPRINFANTFHTVMIKSHTASDLESTSDQESTPDSDTDF